MNISVFIRIILGFLLVFSSTQKLIGPYQNFLYVVQSYECFPLVIEEIIARVFPWIELFIGLFILLGLWLRQALAAAVVLFTSFILILAQALIRKLPIDECGCFGEMITLPPQAMLLVDSFLLIMTALLFKNNIRAKRFSLDSYFDKE